MNNRKINITLIRHGTTEYNEQDRVQGSSNIKLSEKGLNDIAKIVLEEKEYDIFYHSPLSRSKDTLLGIMKNNNIFSNNIIQDNLISERKYGIFEGFTKNEIKQKYPELYQDWMINENIKGNGIESIEQVITRFKKFIFKILNFNVNNILLVTHSGFLYAIYKFIANKPLHLKPDELNIKFPNVSITKLELIVENNELILILNENLKRSFNRDSFI